MKSKYFKIILSSAIIFSFCLLILASNVASDCIETFIGPSGELCCVSERVEESCFRGDLYLIHVTETCCYTFINYFPFWIVDCSIDDQEIIEIHLEDPVCNSYGGGGGSKDCPGCYAAL